MSLETELQRALSIEAEDVPDPDLLPGMLHLLRGERRRRRGRMLAAAVAMIVATVATAWSFDLSARALPVDGHPGTSAALWWAPLIVAAGILLAALATLCAFVVRRDRPR